MKITSNFDSGNIHVISSSSPDDIQLAIQQDNNSAFYQWFHFKLDSQPNVPHKMFITNAGKSAYVDGWKGYQVLASYDREYWFRVPTEFDGQKPSN